MPPPLIGLPGRQMAGSQIADFPDALHQVDVDLYLASYARAVMEAGGIPVHLPVDADAGALAQRLDGVVLTGGADVDPAYYGADVVEGTDPLEPKRDTFELALFGEALVYELPVLGVCRGLQLINVHQGGTLHQNVPEHSRFDVAIEAEVHAVTFSEGSTLRELYGSTQQVNSLHHQTVAELGQGLAVTARADDGGIEGLELGDAVVAVQWHPELMVSMPTDPAFRWLVERARPSRGRTIDTS